MKKSLLIVLAVGLVLVSVILTSCFIWPTAKPHLVLDSPVELATAVIPSDGGEIDVAGSQTSLDGLIVLVPAGAYPQDTEFTISMTEIHSHDFGELFEPATPLITIDNGHGFADEPMVVTIPISKTDDEFAMAFYYDRETGELEGIPFLDVTNDSITIITAHFSDIVVSKARKDRITAPPDSDFTLDTGFKPGRNDFQVVNYGSIVAPDGHCAGQSIAAMYYFNNRGNKGWDKQLNGLLDNNGQTATPGFTWDDATAVRLCSVVHLNCVSRWSGVINQNAGNVLYAFAYAIALTHQPQFIDIRTIDSGHALIVYKVTTDSLYVADPNFPGQERQIKYQIVNGVVKFDSYFSGANFEQATANSTEYTQFNYFALYSLVDRARVRQAWLDVLGAKDPGNGFFPADLSFKVCIGKDPETGDLIGLPLTDGTVITRQQVAQSGYGKLLIYPTTSLPTGDKLWFYNGVTPLGIVDQPGRGGQTIVPQTGSNDIGILYQRQVSKTNSDGSTSQVFRYINFYRFNIILQDDPVMSVSPDSAETVTTLQTTVPGGTSNSAGWTTLLTNGGSISEKLYPEAPSSIPRDVGAKSTVSLTAAGRLRVTVSFASSMGTGPRFYGDEFGYRSYAMMILRDADGKLIDSEWILNDYDTNFAEQVLEIAVASPQTVSIQIAPQSVSCYPETKTPASDGEGCLYLAGSYTLAADFKPGE